MSQHIVVGGASGLIGGALVQALRERGDQVSTLVRREARTASEIEWDPGTGTLDATKLASASTVVVLNGASIGKLPWTRSYREVLYSSRLDPVRTVVQALKELGSDSPALISGSAVGFYGSRPGVELNETASAGDTFLARLCVAWESEARRAEAITPVALLRTAPVIHRDGVLKPLLKLTKWGLGGPLGSGKQIWPWISLADEVAAILHTIDSQLVGPVNICGPNRATMRETGRAVARELHRPYWLPVPTSALRLTVGRDVRDSLLTTDADVQPTALLASGFKFQHPTVSDAIKVALS